MGIRPIDENGNDPWLTDFQRTTNVTKLREVQGDRKQGGTRKIADLEPICSHPAHNPPSHMVYEDGLWENVCPGCGATKIFRVANPRF